MNPASAHPTHVRFLWTNATSPNSTLSDPQTLALEIILNGTGTREGTTYQQGHVVHPQGHEVRRMQWRVLCAGTHLHRSHHPDQPHLRGQLVKHPPAAYYQVHRHAQRNGSIAHIIIGNSVMLGAKFFDDQYFNNAYYAKVGGVPCNEVNHLEVLTALRSGVSPQRLMCVHCRLSFCS